ncbi:guanine nucleotide-exchange factor SEC12 [Anabrus simplex]|uniref:guanine nucleotide-exchange factor SEC12 n=1 Tax=Anabrus simplex TaxID=316456 RepID=UPI0034DD9248
MPPSRRNKDGLLARVNFPLYSVQMLTSRHILVAGGGGSSKTGVANGFEIYELSHDSERYIAEEVTRHETGPSVVMNCATYSNGRKTYLVAGQESHCQLYNVIETVIDSGTRRKRTVSSSDGKVDGAGEPRQRRRMASKESADKSEAKQQVNNNDHSYRQLMFEIKPNDSIQTDFSKEEPLQRVVRIGRNGKIMATAGTDGFVRLWDFPSLKKRLDIAAHSKEVDDLDFSPNLALLVSIAKDGHCLLWDTATGKKVNELKWNVPEDSKYLYKRCRFGMIEGDLNKFRLFTLTNPVGRPAKSKSFLQMWSPEEASLKKSAHFSESLSALSVSDDGRFVAVGTMFSGSVSVYIAFSLQRVLHVEAAHSMFVTGLEFLPSVLDEPAINSATETAVVSISVDNRVCIHDLGYRRTIPPWVAIILIVVVLFLSFVLCSYLGL